jgi:DNA-binding CsgD family transcriptional regulator
MPNKGNIELNEFFDNIKSEVNPTTYEKEDFDKFEAIPILNTQCIYVYDFARKKITYCRNARVLGFENDEFSLFHASNYHVNDRNIINTVTTSAIKHGISGNMLMHDCCLSLTFRLRKKDGTYIQVLKQTTIYNLDNEDRMTTNVTILSDINFINTPGHVNWSFTLKNLDSDHFENLICGDVRTIFTKRELEVIPYLVKNKSSGQIAEKLFISKLTVDSHRKSIKRKSGCTNMYELMTFASRNKLV